MGNANPTGWNSIINALNIKDCTNARINPERYIVIIGKTTKVIFKNL